MILSRHCPIPPHPQVLSATLPWRRPCSHLRKCHSPKEVRSGWPAGRQVSAADPRQELGPVHTPTGAANLHTKGRQALYPGTKDLMLQTLLPRPPLTPLPTQRPSATHAQGKGRAVTGAEPAPIQPPTQSPLGDGAGMLFEGGVRASKTQTSSLQASSVLPTILR